MYLLILESIGTSELILIGLVALIVFGPRKLPEIARTIGKFMTEFRRSTDDFKRTWEREASIGKEYLSEFNADNLLDSPKITENTISKNSVEKEQTVFAPEIKEIKQQEFVEKTPEKEIQKLEEPITSITEKRDWL